MKEKLSKQINQLFNIVVFIYLVIMTVFITIGFIKNSVVFAILSIIISSLIFIVFERLDKVLHTIIEYIPEEE